MAKIKIPLYGSNNDGGDLGELLEAGTHMVYGKSVGFNNTAGLADEAVLTGCIIPAGSQIVAVKVTSSGNGIAVTGAPVLAAGIDGTSITGDIAIAQAAGVIQYWTTAVNTIIEAASQVVTNTAVVKATDDSTPAYLHVWVFYRDISTIKNNDGNTYS